MDISVKIIRILTRLFYLFPIQKRKVVLTAYNGRQYSCSPKYISEGLLRKDGEYRIIYALKRDSKDNIPEGIERVTYRSFIHFYHLMTAGFVVFNSTGIPGLLPYRQKQVIIQT